MNPTALLRGTGLRLLHVAGSEEAVAWVSAGEDGVVDAAPVRRADGRKRKRDWSWQEEGARLKAASREGRERWSTRLGKRERKVLFRTRERCFARQSTILLRIF